MAILFLASIYWAGVYALPRFRLLNLQQAALDVRPTKGTVIYIEDSHGVILPVPPDCVPTMPVAWNRTCYARLDAKSRDYWRFARERDRGYIPRFKECEPGVGVLLFARRQLAYGTDCIVEVFIEPIVHEGGFSCEADWRRPDDWCLNVTVFQPATFFSNVRELSRDTVTVEGLELRRDFGLHFLPGDNHPDKESTPHPFRLFAGEVDANPTDFHIPFELDGRTGIIRGRVLSGGTVRLVADIAPASTRAATTLPYRP